MATLGVASVSICGIPAVLSYNSGPIVMNGTASWQLNALMPSGVTGRPCCPVVATVDGVASQPASVNSKIGILEVFIFSSSSGILPIVTHSNYSLVGPSSAGLKPATPGKEVIAWGTGDCASPSVSVGNIKTAVLFSGQVSQDCGDRVRLTIMWTGKTKEGSWYKTLVVYHQEVVRNTSSRKECEPVRC